MPLNIQATVMHLLNGFPFKTVFGSSKTSCSIMNHCGQAVLNQRAAYDTVDHDILLSTDPTEDILQDGWHCSELD